MSDPGQFDFGGQSVSEAYDRTLVPLLFAPWAEDLVRTVMPEPSWHVVDLAAGTGIVSEKLGACSTAPRQITAIDQSASMLQRARDRCSHLADMIRFVESDACPLNLPDNTIDAVYCQQGFQFFPDRPGAAREMYRVLKPGGQVVLSVWCSVDRCLFFARISETLRACGHERIADVMEIPFPRWPADELRACFEQAGFSGVHLEQQTGVLEFADGVEQAHQTLMASPIAAKLNELADEEQQRISEAFREAAAGLTHRGVTRSEMVSWVVRAVKPR